MLEVGSCDMAKHIKEIRLRAHVVLRLGYDLIRAGHAAYVCETTTHRGKVVTDLSRRMRKAGGGDPPWGSKSAAADEGGSGAEEQGVSDKKPNSQSICPISKS